MRLFIAIEIGDEARQAMAALVADLRRRAGRLAPRARITWVGPDRMHLTVRFIGEVGEPEAEAIVAALRDPIPMAPFTLQWDGLGAFPKKGPPRVLWVGISSGRDAVLALESSLADRLRRLRLPSDDHPYAPHLTLARVRDAAGLRTASLFDGIPTPAAGTHVDAITLFHSQLTPNGPIHEPLAQTALRAT